MPPYRPRKCGTRFPNRDLTCLGSKTGNDPVTSAYRLGKVHQNILSLDSKRVDFSLNGRVMRGGAGLRIVLPAMPGTNHLAAVNDSLAQRPAAVQANVIHGGDGAAHVGHADNLFFASEFPRFVLRRQFVASGDPGKSHRPPPIDIEL